MADEKPTLDEKLRDNRALIAEVQRLDAELALKDQALDEIRAGAQTWWELAVNDGRATSYREGRADGFARCAQDVQRVLTRLDTQGETK